MLPAVQPGCTGGPARPLWSIQAIARGFVVSPAQFPERGGDITTLAVIQAGKKRAISN